jgi:hypothetical protein
MQPTRTWVEAANELRRARAIPIATGRRAIKRLHDDAFLVPSESSGGHYVCTREAEGWTCTCPDFDERGAAGIQCKHVAALLIVQGQAYQDSSSTIRITKIRYRMDNVAFNASQMNEKDEFVVLLRDLCAAIDDLPRDPSRRGPKPIALRDVVASALMWTYTRLSGRRAMSDIRQLGTNGVISRVPSANSTFRAVENPLLTPVLHSLVARSASPMRDLESRFGIDSTGLSVRAYAPGYRAERYGTPPPRQQGYIKFNACIGCASSIITAVEITDKDSSDHDQFVVLLERTVAYGFDLVEVVADAAYSSEVNLAKTVALGGKPYVPYRKGTGQGAGSSALWRSLFHFFEYERDKWLRVYGSRQLCEARFSSMKRLLHDSVSTRTPVAQINQALCIAVATNIITLSRMVHRLGTTVASLNFARIDAAAE